MAAGVASGYVALSAEPPTARLRWMRPTMLAYLVALGATAAAAAGHSAALPVVLNGLIALVLISHAASVSRIGASARSRACLLAGLAIVPIGAVAGAAAALHPVPVLARPALVALVLVAGVVALTRQPGLCDRELGLRAGRWRQQVPIALTGVPLGLAAFALVGEQSVGPIGGNATAAPLAGAAVVALAGAVEELYFRGLLTRAFTRVFGRVGLVWAGVAFALPALAAGSFGLVVVLLLAGIVWGWAYARTGSILGTAVAHAMAAAGLLVVWPTLLS